MEHLHHAFTQPFRLVQDGAYRQVCLKIITWLVVALLAVAQPNLILPVLELNECAKDHLVVENLLKSYRNLIRLIHLCIIWFRVHLFTQRAIGNDTT